MKLSDPRGLKIMHSNTQLDRITRFPVLTEARNLEKIPSVVDLTRVRFTGLLPLEPVCRRGSWLMCGSTIRPYIVRYGVFFHDRDSYGGLVKYYFVLRNRAKFGRITDLNHELYYEWLSLDPQ